MASSLSYGADLRINVVADFTQLRAAFARLSEQEIAKRATYALNRTGGQAQSEVRIEMTRVFDRVTPYALRGTTVKPARPRDLRTEITLKEAPFATGTPADKFLAPEIAGGQRGLKGFERMLNGIGVLPSGWHVAPGAAIKLDPYGNVPPGEITKILSWFQAFGEQGYRANTTQARRDKLRKGTRRKYGYELFAVQPGARNRGHRLAPGIWRRTFTGFGTSLEPMLMFIRPVAYRPRLRYAQIIEAVVKRDFANNLADSFRSAST